ncbi:MAG: radical SAM protein [Synergistaceae bacterium]|nr:radical SAM protein [Synergistaceae bacterium]
MSLWETNQKLREAELWQTVLPAGGDLHWAVLFPNDYSVGASSSGWQFVFSFLRNHGVAAERFCISPVPYRSIDSDTMLERFPIITATISYECDIKKFLLWLKDASIPSSPRERAEKSFPLIGVGGALTYINPLVLSAFCDFVILGDGVFELSVVIKAIRSYSLHGNRKKLWHDLAKNESIFVPPVDVCNGAINRKLKISRDLDLNSANYSGCSIFSTPEAVLGKNILLELQRGCVRNCAYCTLPSCFGKCRQKDFEKVAGLVESICERFPDHHIGLVTPEAGDYYALDKLLLLLRSKNISVSFASLRIDRLSESVLETLTLNGHKSITIAPETANEALRFLCGKKFTNELIVEKLLLAKKFGITKVKLYFMIGLPYETDEDVVAIPFFCNKIVEQTGMSLTLTINPFVPKPWTIWHDKKFIGKNEAKRRYGLITKSLCRFQKHIANVNFSSAREAEEEYNLSWGSIEDSFKLCDKVKLGLNIIEACDRDKTEAILKNNFS